MKKFLKSKAVKLMAIGVLLATTLGVFSGTNISITSPLTRNTIDLRVGYVRIAMASGNMDYPLTQVGVQAALNALPVTGGRLNLMSTSGTVTFAGTVSRAIPNVTIVGTGNVPLVQNNGVTPLFSVGGQTGWVFRDLSTDAGGITLNSDTVLDNVHLGATYYALASTGTANFSAITDSGLTSGRIPVVGASGLLGDDTDLRFSGNTTIMTTANVTTLNAPTGREAVIVVSSNQPSTIKNQADYITDGTADDVEIQAAINSLTSGRTWKEKIIAIGNFTLTSEITVPSFTILDMSKALLQTKAGGTIQHNLIHATDSNYIDLTIGMIDIAYADAVGVGVLWDGVSWSSLDVVGQRIYRLVEFKGTNNGCKRNIIYRVLSAAANPVINGIKLSGTVGKEITLNTFVLVNIVLTSSVNGTAVEFGKYADNNEFETVYSFLNFAGQTGVMLNSDTPGADVGIYENHFNNLVIDQNIAATRSVVEGVQSTFGYSYIKLRTGGGGFPTDPELQTSSRLRIQRSNIATTKLTENTGSANITAGNGSVVVTHGLYKIPVRILLTMAGNPGLVTSVYTTSLNSTNFTITATANFTNNTAIDWRAVTGDGN